MNGRPEHWFLCGGATHADAPADAMRLAAGEGQNLTVDVAGITSNLTGRLPPELRDLILIAAYVLAADQAVPRGTAEDTDMGERWRRDFRFVFGVDRPALWSRPDITSCLRDTLSFLSEDYYTLEFQQGSIRPNEQLSLSNPKGDPMISWDHIDDVLLFSGGLDSLGGAVSQFLHQKRNVILVSHRSAEKTWKTQRCLVSDLRELASDRVLPHVAIRVQRHDDSLRRERTQRTRSFLYAAIAATVAHLVGRRRVLFYENGVVAMNLPVSRQVVGAKATRTAHPKVLKGFARLVSLVLGHDFAVENPFELLTRAEVIRSIGDHGGAGLIKHSVSCAYVHKSSTQYPHCGVCSQCVDRQFSMRAAGMCDHDSNEGYAVNLVGDEWTDEDARTMLLDYVDSAERFSRYGSKEELAAHYGEMTRAVQGLYDGMSRDAEAVGQAVYELHKRHGDGVMRVLSELMSDNAGPFLRGEIKPDSVIALLSRTALERSGVNLGAPDPPEPGVRLCPDAENVFIPNGEAWILRWRGGKPFIMQPHKGMRHLHTLLSNVGDYYKAFALIDIADGTAPTERPMSVVLGVDQETLDSIGTEIERLEAERDEAEFCCDQATVDCLDAELVELRRYRQREASLGGQVRRETPEQKKARVAVSNAVARGIKKIAEYDKLLAHHLQENVRTGFHLKYPDTGMTWVT